jgi:hypothetical protein
MKRNSVACLCRVGWSVLLGLLALAPLLLCVPAASAAALPHAATVSQTRRIAHLRPWQNQLSWQRATRGFRPLGSGNLVWNGGPVQHHPTQYVIFWGPGWATSTNTLNATGQLVVKYLKNVGGTAFERVLTQYHDAAGPITNTNTLAAVFLDASTPPTDATCGANTIQDLAILQEIGHAGQTNNWPAPSADATYFVYTPRGYAVSDGTGFCSRRDFCAYHGWVNSTPGLAYAVVPYADDAGCQVLRSPHHDLAGDSLVSITSHEHLESASDPQVGQGWIDRANFEIGDKCAPDYSKGYTVLRNRTRFELQTEYSNASRSCVNAYFPPRHRRR